MRLRLATAGAVALAVVMMYSASLAAADQTTLLLGVGQDGQIQKANPAAWGAGKAETDQQVQYLQRGSVRVSTRGYHEGGRFALQLPVDLTESLKAAANTYVEMWVRIPEPAKAAGPAGGAGGPGGGVPPGGGMMPGGMQPGGMQPGGMMPGGMMPGGMQPGGMQPGGMMPGGMMGGGTMPGGMQPGGMQPGGMMPGGMMPGGMQPGGMMPGGMQPGGMMPGGMQPGGMMPGGMQPGGMQPGGMMPGGKQAGGMQPGGMMPGGMAPGGMRPGGMMAGGAGGMAPGGLGPAGGPAQPQQPPQKIGRLRLLLVTDKGLLDSGPISVGDEVAMNPELTTNEGWMRISVPLSRFKQGKDVGGGSLQQFALFGDQKGEFNVATVQLVQEDQPLKADAGPDRVVKKGQDVTFTAAPQPGTGKARYAWDFDDLVQGIQEDGLGQKVTHTFDEPGYYVVTLTVTDPDGKRIPQVDRINVNVQ